MEANGGLRAPERRYEIRSKLDDAVDLVLCRTDSLEMARFLVANFPDCYIWDRLVCAAAH
jgi:hypothetical protein